ncbi:MAG: dihydroneopterin aldolase [Kiritimatiellia bacterium]
MDTLLLEGLRVQCIIGDLPNERIIPQEIRLDLELGTDTRSAARSDRLIDTVNYVAVVDAVRAALVGGRCNMIERAAQLAVDACFAVDVRIVHVGVTLHKPHALADVCAGIRISRERNV